MISFDKFGFQFVTDNLPANIIPKTQSFVTMG